LLEQTQQSERLDLQVWKVVLVTALGSLLAQLDATVVNVSLLSLAVDLHSSLQVIQWVTSGYLLAMALMLPLNGWLVERIGAKRLYLICFSGFTFSSMLCALSWSANSLIGFRVLQGMTGGLMTMVQLVIARAAGKNSVRIVGYAAVPVLLGPIVGLVVAGVILQHASWHWFLSHKPADRSAGSCIRAPIPSQGRRRPCACKRTRPDGFSPASPGLVLFLYGSDHLEERTGISAFLLAILLLVFFRKAWKEGPRAVIDVQLFRSRVFSASAVTQFTTNGLSFAGQMLIPVYLIRAAGKSSSATGWLLAPLGLGMMCTYPWVGKLTQHFGIRGTSTGGTSLAFLGTLPFLYLSSHHFNLAILVGPLFIRGIGMSGVGIPSISAAYASMRKEQLPVD
jgi:MFS family permease